MKSPRPHFRTQANTTSRPLSRSALRSVTAGVFGALSLTACTTIPTQDGFLTRSDGLTAAKGVRGKRLETAAPAQAISDGAKLFLEPAVFTRSAEISDNITEVERSLILNALMRSMCADTSRKFEIVDGAETADMYRIRIGVSRVAATGKFGAAIGNATAFVVPVIGVRPPIGLGGLTVEFELVDPKGEQAAAMVWSRSADMASATSVSRIGDAYGFTSEASSSFSSLIAAPPQSQRAGRAIGLRLSGKADEICSKYGREASTLAGAFSALAIPLPPEMTDRGEVKKE
jgi:Protein of unknown function (DUF3313)